MRRVEDARMADDLRHGSVPLLSTIASSNQDNWVRRQGDLYGRQFVLYAAQRFGPAAVPAMVRHAGDLRLALGKDEADLHSDWVSFLKTRPAGASAPAGGSVASSPL